MSGTDLGYGATRELRCRWLVQSAIRLRACYAMSGTEIAYGAISPRDTRLCACYAMSGTEIAYGGSTTPARGLRCLCGRRYAGGRRRLVYYPPTRIACAYRLCVSPPKFITHVYRLRVSPTRITRRVSPTVSPTRVVVLRWAS
eukprot:193116-Rhodomonas_salina.2